MTGGCVGTPASSCKSRSKSAKLDRLTVVRRGKAPVMFNTQESHIPSGIVSQFHDDGFEVWSDQYVQNEPKGNLYQLELRSLIKSRIQKLPEPKGRLLCAAYAGQPRPGTDIENLLFNNIDQTFSAFGRSCKFGCRFEFLGPSPAPTRMSMSHYFRYQYVDRSEPFDIAQVGRLVCSIPEATIDMWGNDARLSLRIWFAVREARQCAAPALASGEPYILRVTTDGLLPAKDLKAVIDGISAACQHAHLSSLGGDIPERIATLLGVERNKLLTLITHDDSPLGEAHRLFTSHGGTQVRVTPDDHRCVAAEVFSLSDEGPPRLAAELFAARGA